jgi:uncharacterized repeat protein (TIGR03803 family)
LRPRLITPAGEGEIMATHPRSGDPNLRHPRARAGALALACISAAVVVTPARGETFETIFNFTVSTGAGPQGALAIDSQGNLYGTTGRVLFRLSGLTFTALHGFGPNEGSSFGRPLLDEHRGAIYGTTLGGGANQRGTVWKFDASGFHVLHSFSGDGEGSFPATGLASDAAGMLYGTTSRGGSGTDCGVVVSGCGTVFKLDPNTLAFTTLHAFTNGSGIFPISEPTIVGVRLYATLPQDTFSTDPGAVGPGRPVHMRKNDGGAYTSIPISGPGSWFFGAVTPDASGNVWGVVRQTVPPEEYGGGIYKIDPLDHYQLAFAFPGIGILGTQPVGRLAYDATKNVFYGVTNQGTAHLGGCGTVYRFNPTTLLVKTLHVFNCNTEGRNPRNGVTLAPDGSLYGETTEGGSDGYGTIFHITP